MHRYRILPWLLLWLVLPRAGAHAKPGAHADVRISITRSAVRVEALMNLRFAEGLVNWSRSVRDEVALDEEAPGRAALLEYFGGPRTGSTPVVVNRPNALVIDLVLTSPVLKEFRILRPAAENRPGFVEVAQALWQQVLVVVEYPCKAPPRSVSFVWGTYPRDFLAPDRDVAPLSDVESILVADGETRSIVFRETEPEYVWHAAAIPLAERFQPVPAALPVPQTTWPVLSVAMGLVGGILWFTWVGRTPGVQRRSRGVDLAMVTTVLVGVTWHIGRMAVPEWVRRPATLPGHAEALAIFQPLHANIYRAFDYTDEGEIYDALARSVDGALLARTYQDIYRSLILQDEGGALSRVKSVQLLTTEVERVAINPTQRTPELTLNARWQVEGVVYHWGHSHSRLNEYRARYTVASVSQGWRIVGVEPLEQRRVDPVAPAALPKPSP